MNRVVRGLATILGTSFAALVVSGVVLVWRYAPGDGGGIRTVHRVASMLSIVTASVLCSALLARLIIRREGGSSFAAGIGVALGLTAASVTGFLLAWDQLALRAVTVGRTIRGIDEAAFDEQIQFILMGTSEVTQATYRAWTLVHTLAIPAALAAAGALIWRSRDVDLESSGHPDGP